MNVGVIGAGSWGTTLANLLAKNGNRVGLWAREPEVVESVAGKRVNEMFLPGIALDESLTVSNDMSDVLTDVEVVVSAGPSHAVRSLAEQARDVLSDRHPTVVSVSKGLDPQSLDTMTDILMEVLDGSHVAALSGPSFAGEVARRRPTAVVAASAEHALAERVQQLFSNDYFRVYTSRDIVGVELGGALKNVIAIAAGIVDGLSLGANPRAALLTRGLAEITRLGVSMGANPLTFSGLAGMGDLLLTCTDDQSRNRTLGIELAKGRTLDEIKTERRTVAEGVNTARLGVKLGDKMNVELPVTREVHAILFDGKTPQQAIRDLMDRELKAEHWI